MTQVVEPPRAPPPPRSPFESQPGALPSATPPEPPAESPTTDANGKSAPLPLLPALSSARAAMPGAEPRLPRNVSWQDMTRGATLANIREYDPSRSFSEGADVPAEAETPPPHDRESHGGGCCAVM